MSQGYCSEPITFENIITNRPSAEVIENMMLLIHFFYDKSLDISEIYFEHNDVLATDDLFYKAMIISLNTFFTPENEEEFREYVEDFRKKRLNSSKKDNQESDIDKIQIPVIDEIITNSKCDCEFCIIYNEAEKILETFQPKNNAELIIFDTLKSDAPKEYINQVYLNPDFYT